MKKFIPALASLALLQGQLAFGAATESTRCMESQDSLNETTAIARTAWAFKCYPGLRGSMPSKQVSLKDTLTGETFLGYPTFARVDDEGNILSFWTAPTDTNASCEGSQQYAFIGFCRAGCYTPDQVVLFSDGFVSIAEAKKSLRDDIVAVSKSATLDTLEFVKSKLESYTADPIPKHQKIIVIKTVDGGELKLTLHHPLVDSQGRMRSANTFEIGEELVKMDGQPDRIISIEKVDYFGKVYNVRPESNDPAENIVVAQGYLNGSVYYQNEGIKELNRVSLRVGNVIPDSLFR